MKGWILPAIATWLLWGIWGFLPKLTTQYIRPTSAAVWEVLGGMALALILLGFTALRVDTHPRGIGLAVATGFLGLLGALFYLTAVSRGKVSVIVTLTALYPAITIALAWLVLKEPLTLKEGIGILFACVAIALFAF